MSVLIEIGIILLLVLLNGVFAMGELAVVSSRRARLLALQKAGMKGASTALSLAENPERMLPTVQIGITLVGILAGAFGEFQPLDSGTSEEAYSRNRRIEMKLTER